MHKTGSLFRVALMVAMSWLSTSAIAVENQTNAKFDQNGFVTVDPRIVQRPWRDVPFDPMPFTYTHAQVKEMWPQLMRGLKLPYPSPEYLKERYTRYPRLRDELKHQDDDWEMHSRNCVEAWILFFRGDFQEAFRVGHDYGGMARVPAIMAEIIYASYLTDLQHEKAILLQDAANWIAHYARLFDYDQTDVNFRDDYLMFRLGYSYAMGRIMEDAPITKSLASGVPFKVVEAVDEMLAIDPNHPIALALQASIDANVIRRVGKAAGKLAIRTNSVEAKDNYIRVMQNVPDMAILRYEHANSLLYIDKSSALDEAIDTLQVATGVKTLFAMEELDRLYAMKRLAELMTLRESGKSFRKFDKARGDYIRKTGVNAYSIFLPPFNVNQ